MGQEITDGDLAGAWGIGNVRRDGVVELELALNGESHDGCGRELHRDGSDGNEFQYGLGCAVRDPTARRPF